MSHRIGVIGTGVMGAEHARLINDEIAGATVTAVHDIDPTRLGEVARRLGARPFHSAEGLIASDQVDAVIVASHDSAHAVQVLACLEAGKPVLCEKPLAPTVEECLRIVDTELALDTRLVSVGFMRRFHPAFVELKQTLRTGELGSPLLILGSHRNVASYPTGGSEGTISNSAVHDVDAIAWLLDSPIVEVSWHAPKATTADLSRHDPQLIHLRTADGVLASVDLFLNARYGYDVRCEVVCEDGAVRLSPMQRTTIDRELFSGHSHPVDWRPYFADAYRLELQTWVHALAEERVSSLATAEDGLRATLVAQALIASMHQHGRVVRVDVHAPGAPARPGIG